MFIELNLNNPLAKGSETPNNFHSCFMWRAFFDAFLVESVSICGHYDDYEINGISAAWFQSVDREITAFRSARHSVGRPRKVFMNKSSTGSTIATPTNLHLPSLSRLSPLPLLISPFDSSDVNTVFTSSGGALYMLPTENENFAVNSRSTY